VPAANVPVSDPRPTAADLRAEQQAKISRHVPDVLKAIMDMHQATAMSSAPIQGIEEYKTAAEAAGIPFHEQARFLGKTEMAAPDIEGIKASLMNDDDKPTS
jgi:hypothetical protein